jgi:hypothetical protein
VYDYQSTPGVVPPALLGPGFGLGTAFIVPTGATVRVTLPVRHLDRHVAIVGSRRHGPAGLGAWVRTGIQAGYSVVSIDSTGWLLDGNEPHDWIPTLSLDRRDPASVSWNWLAEADSQDTIDGLVEALIGRSGHGNRRRGHDHLVLRGILELVRESADAGVRSPRDLARLTSDPRALRTLITTSGRGAGAARLHPLTLSSAGVTAHSVQGARRFLAPFDSRAASRITDGRSNAFVTDELFGQQRHLNVSARRGLGRTLAAMMVSTVIMRAASTTGGRGRPVLLIVDDAGALASRVDLPGLLDVARDAGVALVLGYRDVADIRDPTERDRLFGVGRYDGAGVGTLAVRAGASPASTRLLSDRLGGKVLGAREIGAPPFHGDILTVHSPRLSRPPFLVDTLLGY